VLVDGIWALGDIAGVMPLKHVAVREAQHVVRNAFSADRSAMDYRAIPHAVFSSPQVAAVGKTEEELRDDGTAYEVGRWQFKDTGMGMALRENGLVKVLAGPAGDMLGCHIVGPSASILIQEIVVAIHTTGRLDAIIGAAHAHPTLPQVVEEACKAAAAAELA
jgi:dihydrolipoamide dehydrogenase